MRRKADRIAVRHRHGQIVAVVEIVSPGNKASKNELRAFVEKTANLIAQGVHLLVIYLFPPSKCDPQGIHKAIWDEFVEEDFELPADQRLDARSLRRGAAAGGLCRAGGRRAAIARYAALPPAGSSHAPAPLEDTYRTTWDEFLSCATQGSFGDHRVTCRSSIKCRSRRDRPRDRRLPRRQPTVQRRSPPGRADQADEPVRAEYRLVPHIAAPAQDGDLALQWIDDPVFEQPVGQVLLALGF